MDSASNAITSLIESLRALLLAHGWMLCVAESCTGGMLSEQITESAGSSAWFSCGFITYSNQSKMQMLSVKESSLNEYGAVSEQVAYEMAIGALAKSNCNLSVSITGIAGPDGGSDEMPVGMVCFAWAIKEDIPVTDIKYFTGDRQAIRRQATQHALSGLITHLKNQTH
jgi:nicotinamide-nucleotide amidase